MRQPYRCHTGWRFTVGRAFELEPTSNLVAGPHISPTWSDRPRCPDCREPFLAGQWARPIYGNQGAVTYHDDCVPAEFEADVCLVVDDVGELVLWEPE